jgi:hypothetical protein
MFFARKQGDRLLYHRSYWEQTLEFATSDVYGKAERKPMFVLALERGLLPLNDASP